MKTLNLQAQFDTMVANQDRYKSVASLPQAKQIEALASVWGANGIVVNTADAVEAASSYEKARKVVQKSLARVKARVKKTIKVARATTIIFNHTVEAVKSAAAVSLLITLGRKTSVTTAYGEVLNLPVETLAFASKEEAVNSAWNAFKAVMVQSA